MASSSVKFGMTHVKVVLVAVMRKLLHIVYGVWKHDADYEPSLAFPEVA